MAYSQPHYEDGLLVPKSTPCCLSSKLLASLISFVFEQLTICFDRKRDTSVIVMV